MRCDPKDVALKSFFLGPQAENGWWIKDLVDHLFKDWFLWRRDRFPADGRAISDTDLRLPEFRERRQVFRARFEELTRRFEAEVPKFSPRYVGHMFSETSLPALLGHLVALLHNPNNISGESSRVGVEIESEALRALQQMIGYPGFEAHGHFTSGGTVANIEALVRARSRLSLWLAAGAAARVRDGAELDLFTAAHLGWERFSEIPDTEEWNLYEGNPFEVCRKINSVFKTDFAGPVALVPENKHYSWKKGVSLLGVGDTALWPIALDRNGRLSVSDLRRLLERAYTEQKPVLLVVSVVGSTEFGTIDPVHEVQAALDEWAERGVRIWHHVDAAYGGFFRALDLHRSPILDPSAVLALEAVPRTNSITLDPHKLGYVPYACGTFLCRDFADYSARGFSAPYVQSNPHERGIFTLEGSRPATGAAATWMTANAIGLGPEGYGRIIERTIRIKRSIEAALRSADPRFRIAPRTDTNILAFTWAERGAALSSANSAAERVYAALSPQGKGPFFVSKTRLSLQSYRAYLDDFLTAFEAKVDSSEMTVVRVCIMNPFFDSVEMNADFEKEFVQALLKILESK